MSELLEKLERADASLKPERDLRNMMRLHNAKMIESKGSQFWAVVCQQVGAICNAMLLKYRDEPGRNPSATPIHGGFRLGGPGLPRLVIEAVFEPTGQHVRIHEGEKVDFRIEPVFMEERPPILIAASADAEGQEYVTFKFGAALYRDPCALADAFVERVLAFRH
jgi:hypothetical protein